MTVVGIMMIFTAGLLSDCAPQGTDSNHPFIRPQASSPGKVSAEANPPLAGESCDSEHLGQAINCQVSLALGRHLVAVAPRQVADALPGVLRQGDAARQAVALHA